MSDPADALEMLIEAATSPSLQPATKLQHTLETSVNEEQRRIYLTDIDDSTGNWFCIVLDHFNSISSEPIDITLNTPGGSITSEFTIHDAIRKSKSPVTVLGTGEVCSAGALILACAHKRYVTESCCLMIHEPTVGGDGGLGLKASKDRRKLEDFTLSHWCELMSRYTKDKDAKAWASIVRNKAEFWRLGGKEIVDAQLADEVI